MDQPSNLRDKDLPIVLVVDNNSAIRNIVTWSLQLSGKESIS
jgi:hypothetical protein